MGKKNYRNTLKIILVGIVIIVVLVLSWNFYLVYKINSDLEKIEKLMPKSEMLISFYNKIDSSIQELDSKKIKKIVGYIENETSYTFKNYYDYFFPIEFFFDQLVTYNIYGRLKIDISFLISRNLLSEFIFNKYEYNQYKSIGNRKLLETHFAYWLNQRLSDNDKLLYFYNTFSKSYSSGLVGFEDYSIKLFDRNISELSETEFDSLLNSFNNTKFWLNINDTIP